MVLLLVVLPIVSIIPKSFPSDLWYNVASSISRDEAGVDVPCYWHGCTNQADYELQTDTFYSTVSGYTKALKLMQKMPNEAGLQSQSGSYTSTNFEKHTSYDKGTYLTPQSDGSIKVEKKMKAHDYYEPVTKVVGKEFFYGYYCDEHDDIAYETIQKEVRDVFYTKNFGYWLGKLGLWVWGISIAVIAVCAYIVLKKDKQKAEAKNK